MIFINTSIGLSSKESEISALWVWTKGIAENDDDDEISITSSEWEFSHLKQRQGEENHDSLLLSSSAGTISFNESFVMTTMENAAIEAIQRAYEAFHNRTAKKRQSQSTSITEPVVSLPQQTLLLPPPSPSPPPSISAKPSGPSTPQPIAAAAATTTTKSKEKSNFIYASRAA